MSATVESVSQSEVSTIIFFLILFNLELMLFSRIL